ncbi:hypothetical protein GCM10010123_09190 [Pilimelia anulata]|uniref:Transglutaminase-like domain-containing protein n=1 Tax=Pilimelia anulata TaxID=53371 RepID=A0A8J3B7F8_9ACTN|nr:transglutaminase domain-containing protein [Pilimelia anulata]GGJ81569.1 hypothetical protein GCM10010123_09190 [Pilimelia anulata]
MSPPDPPAAHGGVVLGGVGGVVRRVLVPVLLVVVAGVVADRIFDGTVLTRLVAGAAGGAAAISLLLARGRGTLVAPLSVVALAGYLGGAVALTAHRAGLPGPLPPVAADALANGLPRLLGAMIPVEPQPDTVVVPLAAAWLATMVAVEVALRTGRMLLAYAAPAALFVGALYLVGPNAGPAAGATVAFLVVAAAGLVTVPGPRRPADAAPGAAAGGPAAAGAGAAAVDTAGAAAGESGWAGLRRLGAAGAAVAVTGVVALAGAAALAPVLTGRPADPRAHLIPPQLDTLDENPLVRLSGWALQPRQKLFDVRLAGNPVGARLRLAVLSAYDGVTWRVGATYRSAGRALPAGAPAPGARRPVRQEVTVAGLSGRLLPAADRARRVAGVRVAYDPDGGTLLGREPLRPGLRYAVDSTAAEEPANLLVDAEVPSGAGVARLLDTGPEPPAALAGLAERLAGEAVGAYDRAAALEEYLRAHYRLVADAPSGHAYPNLRFFLFGAPGAGGQRGTSEQFAAAYAVLGRLLGLPTRIVVGFRVGAGGGAVRAGDALAWPEVLFRDLGWVAFDPLPRADQQPQPIEPDARPRPDPSTPPPVVPDEPTPGPTATPAAVGPPAAAPGRRAGTVLPLVAAAAVLLLAGPVAALALARRRLDRRRRTAPEPARRIAGAWHAVRDARRLAGRPLPAHLTATAVADAARAEGAPPLDALAAAVNAAAFAPAAPDPAAPDTAAADAAVAAAGAYAAHLRAGRGRWGRWSWPVHPGPLRWAAADRTPPRRPPGPGLSHPGGRPGVSVASPGAPVPEDRATGA